MWLLFVNEYHKPKQTNPRNTTEKLYREHIGLTFKTFALKVYKQNDYILHPFYNLVWMNTAFILSNVSPALLLVYLYFLQSDLSVEAFWFVLKH